MATASDKPQGIPVTENPFKIKNLEKKMFIIDTKGVKNPSLHAGDTGRMELFFALIPAEGSNNSSYLIKSVNTNLALTDNSSGDEGKSVEVQALDKNNKRQLWSIQASSKYSTGCYRVLNLSTSGFLSARRDSNQLQTLAEYPEDGYQNWTFFFTGGLGIPSIDTEIRIKNDLTSRILYAGDKVFLRDRVNNLREQIFALVPSTLSPGAYLIQSLSTGLYLKDDSDGSGKSNAVKTTNLDQSSQKIVWRLLPGTKYPGTYRIQNLSSKGCLLNGPPGHNELQTLKDTTEYHDQCWSFLDASS